MSNVLDPFAYEAAQHEASVLAWRRARLARLTAEDSWLSLVGKFPLHDGDNRVGAADGCEVLLPADKAGRSLGRFTLQQSSVTFTLAPNVSIALRTEATTRMLAANETVPLTSDRAAVPDLLLLGSLTLEVMERESGFAIRVRDSENPARLHFPGIDHYPIAAQWRVVAKLEPYDPHKSIELAYETNSTEHYVSPGSALFEVAGHVCRVDPVIDGNRSRLFLVFWDPTARDTTYGAGRFLYAPLPKGDRVLLDFNQAFSPPCAFTAYAMCPLPPPQNRLAVRVEAGEKYSHA
jgi:hypothetical protein